MSITRTQVFGVTTKPNLSGSVATHTFASVPTPGSLLVVVVSNGDDGGDISIVSFGDNIGDGNTWTPTKLSPQTLYGSDRFRIYYKTVGTPSGGGKSISFTITGTQSLAMFAAEYNSGSNVLWSITGSEITAALTPAALNVGSITVDGSDSVIISVSSSDGSNLSGGTNYTRQAIAAAWAADSVEDRLITSPGTYSVDWGTASFTQARGYGVAFKATQLSGPIRLLDAVQTVNNSAAFTHNSINGISSNDLYLDLCYNPSSTGIPSAPTFDPTYAFTNIASGLDDTTNRSFALGYRVATGSEVSLDVTPPGGSTFLSDIFFALSGIDTTTPIESYQRGKFAGLINSPIVPSSIATKTNSWHIVLFSDTSGGLTVLTPPAGYSLIGYSVGNGNTFYVYAKEVGIGPTGAVQAVYSSGVAGIAAGFIVRPSGGTEPTFKSIGPNTTNDYSGATATSIKEAYSTTNYSGSVEANAAAYSAADNTSCLIRFDGISNIPSNATIVAAGIRLTIADGDTGATLVNNYAIHKLQTSYNDAQATWLEKSTGVTWATAGATSSSDRDLTPSAIAPVNYSTSIPAPVTVMFTGAGVVSLVQSWLTTNNGAVISRNPIDANDFHYLNFWSDNGTTDGYRPELLVWYTVGGSPIQVYYFTA